MCLHGEITDSDDDEPSEVTKLTHSELLIYFHEVNVVLNDLWRSMPNLNHKKIN